MPLRYQVDDLLKLRASPLSARPASLPPIEEWMGPQDAHTKRPVPTRGKQEDSVLPNETFQKRPSLLDAPGLSRKSSTAPEDIVLGPPRRSFASANARAAAKAGIPETPEDGLPPKDRSSLQTRLRNGDGAGKNDDDDARTEGINRRTQRHDRDEAPNGRPRRGLGEEDGEGRTRRNFDRDRERPRWDMRGGKEEGDTKEADSLGLDDRSANRRDPGSRAKFDQPWVRKSGGLDDFTKSDQRPQEWRRDRGRDREWDRSGKIESEPEWMDTGDVEEPPQAHTQEDFQRWKERMKKGGTPAEERRTPLLETTQVVEQVSEEQKPPRTAARGANSSDQSDAMDIFFAKFNDQKTEAESKPQQVKPAGRTRFASIFSPPPEAQQSPVARPLQPPVESSTAVPVTENPKPAGDSDQEAFQRILQMLGTRNSSSTSEIQGVQQPKTSLYGRKEQPVTLQARPEVSMAPLQQSSSLDIGPVNGASGFERLPDPMSPPQGRPESDHNQDSQLILNLMRQANLGERQQEPRHEPTMQAMAGYVNQSAVTQNQQIPGMSTRNRDIQQRNDDSFYDEQSMYNMRDQEQQLRRGSSQRRPTSDQLPAFFDDPYLSGLRRDNPQQPKPMPQHQIMPPGLQRPPGLDRMPLGWPGQPPPQQQQQQARQPPPPGMSIPPQRGVFPQMNMPPPQSLPQTQQQPRRKYTGDSGVPSLPPGFGPPPGFMGMNGPPPGFPGNINQNFPRYQEQPGVPPRSMMDRYGNIERGAVRGGAGSGGLGNGMGGQFR